MSEPTRISEGQKLILALHNLIQDDFSVSDDTILDKLFVHIEDDSGLKDEIDSLYPELSDWIVTALTKWTENGIFQGVQTFVLRFIGFVGSSPIGFKTLKEKNILKHIIKQLETTNEIKNDSCLMVPTIIAFRMFLKHQDGWSWITETMVWKHTVNSFYDNQSIYINREAVKFISVLLNKSVSIDSQIGNEILKFICAPLEIILCVLPVNQNATGMETFNCTTLFDSRSLTEITDQVKSARYLCEILEYMLSSGGVLPGILLYFWGDIEIPSNTLTSFSQILQMGLCNQDFQIFAQLLLMIDIFNVIRTTPSQGMSQHVSAFCLEVENMILITASGDNEILLQNVVNFCPTVFKCLAKLENRLPALPIDTEQFSAVKVRIGLIKGSLSNFMRVFLSVYLFDEHFTKYFSEEWLEESVIIKKEIVQCFPCLPYYLDVDTGHKKVLQLIQITVLGLSRSLQNLETQSHPFRLVVNTTEVFMNVVMKEQTSQFFTVFRHLLTLTYNMMNGQLIVRGSPRRQELFNKIHNIVQNILTDNAFKLDVMTQILGIKLLKISLKLLFQDLGEDSLNFQLCRCKSYFSQQFSLHLTSNLTERSSWEIRDTILEFFQTVAELTEIFPLVICDCGDVKTEILTRILKLARTDEYAYVRASALNFFSKMTRAKIFSNLAAIVSPADLLDLAVTTMSEDDMPMVRKAACDLIAALYITHIPNVLKDANKMYEAVFIATSKDLDWEVKKSALSFWQITIDRLIMDEIHPSVLYHTTNLCTEKKTTRKIMDIFNLLGEIGCLKSIWLGINDECDVTVSEDALNIVNKIQSLDNRLHFIDRILNSDESMEDDENLNFQKMRPKEFFLFIQNQEWRENLTSRKDWLENQCDDLTSLLDHILNAESRIEDGDHNAVDCY